VEPSFGIDMAQPVKTASPFRVPGLTPAATGPDKLPLLHHRQPIPLKGNGLLGLPKVDGLAAASEFPAPGCVPTESHMKSSLVILYHREPYDEVKENGKTVYREKKSPNGIVPTLKSFFANAESSTWVAWKQVTPKQQENFEDRVTMEGWSDKAVIRRIPLSADRVKNFYYITAKEAFWPILHSFPEHFTYESSDWENFKHINQLFAEAAMRRSRR
jgi:hypothetical protein